LPPALSKVQHRQDWLLKENENISFQKANHDFTGEKKTLKLAVVSPMLCVIA
jgi:hypothetical protein